MTQTHLVTAPFPELWHGAKSVVVIDGVGLDGKVFIDDPSINVKLVKTPEILSNVTDLEFTEFQLVCSRVMTDLAMELNRLHGSNFVERYWRIVVGAWLQQFAQILYLRWKVAEFLCLEYKQLSVPTLAINWQELLPVTHDEASLLFATDIWNHRIYVDAYNYLQGTQLLSVEIAVPSRNHELLEYRKKINFGLPTPQPKSRLETLLAKLSPNPKVVIAGVVQSKRALIAMHLRLGSLPRLWRFNGKIISRPIDEELRMSFPLAVSSKNRFEVYLRRSIPIHLPTIYLEGFADLLHQAKMRSLTKHPKIIFSNTLLQRNEQFKVWCAEHVTIGSTKLVSGQHGGGYGVTRYKGWGEQYELSVVDRFLSWGWSDDSKLVVPTCVQLGNPNSQPSNVGGLLIVLGPITRNSDIYGMIWVQSNSSYFDFLRSLVDSLPENVKKLTVVRPKNASQLGKPARVSAQQVDELLGKTISIDHGTLSLSETQSKQRLSIVTYNETTIPMNMMAGFPTIALWDPKYVRLNPTAELVYKKLAEVKILFHSPELAARHVAEIWDDVDSWWQSPVVVQAREKYCNHYARKKRYPSMAVAGAIADYR